MNKARAAGNAISRQSTAELREADNELIMIKLVEITNTGIIHYQIYLIFQNCKSFVSNKKKTGITFPSICQNLESSESNKKLVQVLKTGITKS